MSPHDDTAPREVRGEDHGDSFACAWHAELQEIYREAMAVTPEPEATKTLLDAAVDAAPDDLSALCLSGGGIRSATFGLGVIQALARFGLLNRFHYLSTVSGGGYIGTWLSTWRHRHCDATVMQQLNELSEDGNDPEQIRGLRADSNYITPRLGLLSADTWTVVTLYIRNLLLNWLMFAPFFIGCLLLPFCWNAVLVWLKHFHDRTHYGFIGAGTLLLLFGLACGVRGRFHRKDVWLTRARFLKLVLLPIVASAICFCVAAQAVPYSPWTRPHSFELGVGIGVFAYFVAWAIGRLMARPSADYIAPWEVLGWTLSGGLVGAIVTLGVLAAPNLHTDLSAIFGISWCVTAYLVGDIFYVGASSFGPHGEMDREWLARAAGWLAVVAILWAIIAMVALWGPALLGPSSPALFARIAKLLGVTSVAGAVTLFLGWSDKTGATLAKQAGKRPSLIQIASGAAVLFALALGIVLAYVGQTIVADLEKLQWSLGWANRFPVVAVAVMIGLVVIAFVISCFVNINRFSLHALYRNRLSRAYIGSALWHARCPDPFTGFAVEDNVCLAKVKPKPVPEREPGKDRLFHIINATLNVVSPQDLAWQERKAESFTFSRLHCGNPHVTYRRTPTYGGKKGGLTLATAMAISGAAVSPNEGYNSSPLIAFLLMLFNVRLGWWLGNPKGAKYRREGPNIAITPALKELAGDTTEKARWIYLSDGGHFENLGLYEVIRRRCRFIVAVDAGCDPKFTFDDLGNATRKIFIDFGVAIEFSYFELQPRQTPPVPGARFAIGTISYPGCARQGWILYIKPTYQASEGMDIRSYANAHPSFPHESTADQWFSESQLESYRALGAFITTQICTVGGTNTQGTMSLAELRSAAEDYIRRLSRIPKTPKHGGCEKRQ